MRDLKVGSGERLDVVVERAVDLVTSGGGEPVSFVFNEIKNVVRPGMSMDDVWRSHFDAVRARRDAHRAASPEYAEARRLLEGLSFDVKNALRSLLSDEVG